MDFGGVNVVKDFLDILFVVIAIAIIAALLPQIKAPLKWLVKKYIDLRVARCVKRAEKKFCQPNMGETKKAWVLERTEKYENQLKSMNDTIDEVIEQAVAILKAQQKTSVKTLKRSAKKVAKECADSARDAIASKLSGKDKDEVGE